MAIYLSTLQKVPTTSEMLIKNHSEKLFSYVTSVTYKHDYQQAVHRQFCAVMLTRTGHTRTRTRTRTKPTRTRTRLARTRT